MNPVIVLCGGLGTRLRETVPGLPKVLAPVAGSPFLDHLLRLLAAQGITDVVLAAGVGADQVSAAAGDGARWGLKLATVAEPRPLGTSGAVRFARDAAAIRGPVFVMNGDTYFDGSLERLVQVHGQTPLAAATLSLVRVDDAARYGTVRYDPGTAEVTGFMEKNPLSHGPAWISAGVYLLSEAVVDSMQQEAPGSIERDVFPDLVGRGLRAATFPAARFIDIGTPADYERAQSILGA